MDAVCAARRALQQVALKALSLKGIKDWKQLELFQREAVVLQVGFGGNSDWVTNSRLGITDRHISVQAGMLATLHVTAMLHPAASPPSCQCQCKHVVKGQRYCGVS